MITKAQVKHIQSLEDKKYRNEYRAFVIEGDKMVRELFSSNLKINIVYALKEWIDQYPQEAVKYNIVEIEPFELAKISTMKTPNKILAIAELPSYPEVSTKLALLLDGIQDPGNLGSIIRIADWYQIPAIYCSYTTADAFNSKVIQASMGSVFRIPVIPCDLKDLIRQHPALPVFATVLGGKDINTYPSLKEGFIIIGNESSGVSEDLKKMSTEQITILRKGEAESLNAAVATGIICHCMLS